jgi:hypothetical protein
MRQEYVIPRNLRQTASLQRSSCLIGQDCFGAANTCRRPAAQRHSSGAATWLERARLPSGTATVTRKQTIEEPQTTGWYESSYRAGYAVAVTGCGKQTVYAVECDKRRNGCATGRLQQAPATASQRTLADELQPLAVQAARQIGAQELQCPGVTTEVTHKDTICLTAPCTP